MKNDYKYILPKNFDPNDSEFDIFKDIKSVNFYKPEIILKKNFRIATNSVAFQYFKILRESCISVVNFEKYQKGYKFFLKFILPKFNFSKKRFLLITDEWTSNYYHWHIFTLQKLVILQTAGTAKDAVLFLPKKYKSYKFVLSSLKIFGIDEKQIVFLPKKSNIKTKELALVKMPQYYPQALAKVRETFLKANITKDLGFGEKIYISREGQKLRFVENEKEVVELLQKYGFKKIIAEKFSYQDQMNIMRGAKYVVGPHGAGLTNILFMKENSSILEIATEPHHEKPITDYFRLASLINFNYFYHESKFHSGQTDTHMSTFYVDLAKLEKNLKQMLENE